MRLQKTLIKTTTQDPEPPQPTIQNGGQAKKPLFYKLSVFKASFALLVLLGLVFPPTLTRASFLDFVGNILNTENVDASERPIKNSQTAGALSAITSVDPLSDTGGSVIETNDGALVPSTGPMGTAIDIQDAPETDEISLYVVREGDTISSIAEMYEVTSNTIYWANNIVRGQKLKEGTVLTILPISGVTYKVKKGDTLSGIVKKYKGDLDEVQSFNGVTTESELVVGTVITIPDGEVETIVSQPKIKKVVKVNTQKQSVAQSSLPLYEGYYIRPIKGGRKSQGLHDRVAVDLAAPIGTPIVASASGVVVLSKASGYNGGYGLYVIIQHSNGTKTLYAHMSRVSAVLGSTVAQGEVIGYVGSTGRSTGPHVHFEVRGAKNPGATKGVWER